MIILIRVRQVVTQPPDTGVGFASLNHDSVHVPENIAVGQVVYTVGLDQKPESSRGLSIKCEIMKVVDATGKTVRGKCLTNKAKI